ncbi:MAG: 4a-hydroxytetrahydrobiopterin dehydratase [Gammaproteobacteria bacterium]|nr:4a-hydroxytetrahydrobiopterin dehydratase [Gammaproteobacteria bacterium]
MSELATKRCLPCEGGVAALSHADANRLMHQLKPHWKLLDGDRKLQATLEFKNYFRTLAFVNAAAYIAIREDHHPDISFGFKTATVTYWTHAIGGLSDNDFICAAKIDALTD